MARVLRAGAVGLAALAGAILWAAPAEACTCAPRTVDEALAEGHTQPYVAPGVVTALIFERKDGAWRLGPCTPIDLGQAVQRAQGDPVAEKGGSAVAYAAGDFGSARLVALDRTVALGRTLAANYEDRVPELTVHDAATLRVLRTAELDDISGPFGVAMQCADPDAERVRLLSMSDGYPELPTVGGATPGQAAGQAAGQEPAAGGSDRPSTDARIVAVAVGVSAAALAGFVVLRRRRRT